MESSSKKITFISQTQVRIYKVWLIMIISLLTFIAILTLYRFFVNSERLFNLWLYAIVGWHTFRVYRKIKAVEFDEEFLYVTEKGYEIVMPLENIRNVQIKSLNGIYSISLFNKVQSGEQIYFKPSLIYPLDFGKQDKKVSILRDYVRKARKVVHTIPPNRLQS